ncbi:peptide chain release factor N(5)-glutamine methyltransferase [Kaarinaea lacus]
MSTIQQTLAEAQSRLNTLPDISPKLESEILLAYVVNKPRSYLYTWPEQVLETHQLAQFQSLVDRRCTGEPIAYITSLREFWGLPLKVSPATLIPRPETERLVEIALQHIPDHESWQIADLGTGSGALALAIASERPQCQLIATDISADALRIAEQNRNDLQLNNVRFIQGRWFEPLNNYQFDLVVSNPPYVAENDPHLLEGDLRYEPQQALSAGPDGLDAIREILATAIPHLKPGAWLMVEHGYDQGNTVMALFAQSGFEQVICHADYAERERTTVGQVASNR